MAVTDFEGMPKHDRRPHSEMRTQVSVIDISRAYFNAVKDPESDPRMWHFHARTQATNKASAGCSVFTCMGHGPPLTVGTGNTQNSWCPLAS